MRLTIAFILTSFFTLAQNKISFYFDHDKHTISFKEQEKLEHWLRHNKESLVLFMVGSTDESGKVTYNDHLSLERIKEITKYVYGNVKFSNHYSRYSLGEKYLISNKDAENRRVDMYFLDEHSIPYESLLMNNIDVENSVNKIKIEHTTDFNSKDSTSLNETINSNPVNTLYRLDMIHFQADSEKISQDSKHELLKWIDVMKLNQKMKIVIQGHICCVPRDDFYLSTRRAKEVTKFFNDNGVAQERMQYIGFGPDRPIYAIPEKNGVEAYRNRRVEILVTEK